MVTVDDYGTFETAWCPGCGDHSLLAALKSALAGLGLPPHKVLVVTGIGQAAKTPLYMNCNMITGLHGRSLPTATGAKLANPEITVIAESGDGCNYGEGGNHFLAALRRNLDMTLIVHDNGIYGLTKGQASPTTAKGQVTKAQPFGQPSEPVNPVALAVTMGAAFVARGFTGEPEHLSGLIQQAVTHKGFSLVDVFQPCVSFNKVNTFAWYKQRCYKIGPEHDPSDPKQALALAREFGERIPIGVLSRNDRPVFGAGLPTLEKGPLALRKPDLEALRGVLASYG
ncbi:MAG TPA: 2-oxoacid:ferredoxin oxidoreductase subunit beta [Humidesulfovibrio sp.]|uniref:2-oxoacid:ferredoxin oxidoreductase subunit beta n=1 Tax=Humidesulfovibrio sp. TaxID=2910988 RepID=UPI002C172E0B|nr:2-oxoacid:ferredoxin oxidoreductase subunit beta [Humidesulfovibrio sp.]HWR02617.1 2-oxoacid:ferredoxin oxidoreductase subunit beta [Humidesulfovibrio sp.]